MDMTNLIIRVAAASIMSGAALGLVDPTVAGEPDGARSNPGQNSESIAAVEHLRAYLATEVLQRPLLLDQAFAQTALTKSDADAARRLLVEDRRKLLRQQRREEFEKRSISSGELNMPFFFKKFGQKPSQGWSLYISMHGGGQARKRVNDSQWENQKRLYQLKEGIYVAPRAPTDTWNMWHQAHIDKMFGRLIEDFILFESVDPNRIYLMGYSAGGDGVYQLAPRMADRFAAAAMMAGHPNETSALGLRNLPFTIHMGGRDSGFRRNQVAAKWKDRLGELAAEDQGGYRHLVKIYPNKGHWMDREDAAAIPWMAGFERQIHPTRIVWVQDDVTHDRFYWLAVDQSQKRARMQITAEVNEQSILIEATDLETLTVRLHDGLLDLDRELSVSDGQRELYRGRAKRTIGTMYRTLLERFDPAVVYPAEVRVSLKPAPKPQ